jgi:hypothetical protein
VVSTQSTTRYEVDIFFFFFFFQTIPDAISMSRSAGGVTWGEPKRANAIQQQSGRERD